jgi:hypothetical protein
MVAIALVNWVFGILEPKNIQCHVFKLSSVGNGKNPLKIVGVHGPQKYPKIKSPF